MGTLTSEVQLRRHSQDILHSWMKKVHISRSDPFFWPKLGIAVLRTGIFFFFLHSIRSSESCRRRTMYYPSTLWHGIANHHTPAVALPVVDWRSDYSMYVVRIRRIYQNYINQFGHVATESLRLLLRHFGTGIGTLLLQLYRSTSCTPAVNCHSHHSATVRTVPRWLYRCVRFGLRRSRSDESCM